MADVTVKEKVINEAIGRIKKRIEVIDKVFDATPLIDIFRLEINAMKAAQKEENPSKALGILNSIKPKIIELKKVAKKQRNMSDLIKEKVKLQFELQDLNRELYYISLKSKL